MEQEHLEQVELDLGELDQAVASSGLSGCQIKREVLKAKDLAIGHRCTSTQQRPQSGGQDDEGKRFAETMFETYRQVHGLEIRIARIFRTYGPRMPLFDGQLIPDFILSALDEKELVLNGGKAFRSSLCFVTDLVDGMMRVMHAKEYVGPVNLGSDVDLSLEDVAKRIIEMTGSHSKMVEGENFAFLSELSLPNIDRAKELGWFPLVRLEDGLRRTIEYLKANKILMTSV